MMSDNRERLLLSNRRPRPPVWLLLATVSLMLAAAFRLINLTEVPPGLAQDEILDADIATFILGGEHALFFSHGYGHEPLYHYWAVPFQVLFGDNVLAIRLPSVFLGMMLVALTMRWARRDYGAVAALVAGFGLAVSWWPVIFSRIGIRPILEPVLLVAAVWFWPLSVTEYTRKGLRSAVFAGLLFGLSIYTYTAARIILLIPFLLLVFQGIRWLWAKRKITEQNTILTELKAQVIYAAIVLTIGVLVYLPLAARLRANPQLQQRLDQLEGPLSALQAGDVSPVLGMTGATLGVFSFTGDPRWTYSLPDRPLFDPVTAVLFYSGLLLAFWRWRQPIYVLLPIWLFVTLLPSALSPDAPSTIRLIGALPIVYLLPGLAIDKAINLLKGKSAVTNLSQRRAMNLLAGISALVLGINSVRTIRDGFVLWPQDLETRLRYQTAIRDIGQRWLEEGAGRPPVVAEVFYEPIDAASLRRNIGLDPQARWIQTGAGVDGALVWPRGESADLYVPEYAPLDPELMNWAGLESPPDYRSTSRPSFAVYSLPSGPAVNIQPIHAIFGFEAIATLEGIVIPDTNPIDHSVHLASWWHANENLPEDLAIFIHLVDDEGEVVAQFDGLDVAPSTLQPGDAALQRHLIPLPEVLDPGVFSLRLGLYRRTEGQRIPLISGEDSLEVAQCQVYQMDVQSIDCSLTRAN